MEHGPVDLLVLTFADPQPDGSVTAKLAELAQAGIIRVLDAAVVAKGEDGSRHSFDIEDLPAEERAVFGYVETGTRGLFDSDDAEALFEALAPGSAAAVLAIEHAWAIGLAEAISDVGGEVAMATRVPGAIVDEALALLAGGDE